MATGPAKVRVFGPAYLDRVLRVDQPLRRRDEGGPIDRSVEGQADPSAGLTSGALELVGDSGRILIDPLPFDWPGPVGTIRLRTNGLRFSHATRTRGVAWQDDLGGMGAGYARALDGELVVILGDRDDPTSRAIRILLDREGVSSTPIHRTGMAADWTLLVTSGPHGDKLPIGFRGLLRSAPLFQTCDDRCDLLVVASLTNRLAASALGSRPARVKFFAPTLRNMLDREPPLTSFASGIDVLSCNREEWEACADRDSVAEAVRLLLVTEGSQGSLVRYVGPEGRRLEARMPAFPRARPPRDTNRAGECYASTFLASLIDQGWQPGPLDEDQVSRAASRASAAAALVLDRTDFGFPTADEIDEALHLGRVD